MASVLKLPTHIDPRGNLTVIDKELPFDVKRVYYIYGVAGDQVRAGHRHKKTIQLLVCVRGSCEVFVNDGSQRQTYLLDRPDLGLLMEPQDWHTMFNFTPDSLLLVLASEYYDVNDYIDEEYP